MQQIILPVDVNGLLRCEIRLADDIDQQFEFALPDWKGQRNEAIG
jgi:hypothetical protein